MSYNEEHTPYPEEHTPYPEKQTPYPEKHEPVAVVVGKQWACKQLSSNVLIVCIEAAEKERCYLRCTLFAPCVDELTGSRGSHS